MSSLIQEATIKIRQDTSGNWGSENPTPLQGEFCLETDTGKIKIGDGGTLWNNLIYFLAAATTPAHYERDIKWAATNHTLTSPDRMSVNIGTRGYLLDTQLTLNLDTTSNWDDVANKTPGTRAGKDFYIYACEPASGSEPDIVLSEESTFPLGGYNADDSRKIGGFHCLCEDVDTIAGHDLTDYVAGDILPASVWDLNHRPASEPEGMVYIDGIDKWMDIYLASWSGTELESVKGGTIADGTSTKHFHWYKFVEEFGKIGKQLPMQQEFIPAVKGSPEGTNIVGSTDPGDTGGYDDTTGQRIISNYGLEDCVGVMFQWGGDTGSDGRSASWVNEYDADANSDNSVAMGQSYEAPNRPRFGGAWNYGALCGSRCSRWDRSPLGLRTSLGARGVSNPRSR